MKMQNDTYVVTLNMAQSLCDELGETLWLEDEIHVVQLLDALACAGLQLAFDPDGLMSTVYCQLLKNRAKTNGSK
jgi:hypothetical protein